MLRTMRSPMPPARLASAGIACFAAALSPERIVRAGRFFRSNPERGHIVRARYAVIEVGARDELARLLVVVAALGQRLPDSLRQSAVHLPLDDHRVDDLAEVVHCGEIH